MCAIADNGFVPHFLRCFLYLVHPCLLQCAMAVPLLTLCSLFGPHFRARGGMEAEREERRKIFEEKEEKQRRNLEWFREMREEARRKREAGELPTGTFREDLTEGEKEAEAPTVSGEIDREEEEKILEEDNTEEVPELEEVPDEERRALAHATNVFGSVEDQAEKIMELPEDEKEEEEEEQTSYIGQQSTRPTVEFDASTEGQVEVNSHTDLDELD
uniref:Uncharacterized protein n=1 Tax=Palpitomonas bilix TaxID=652834 RepID=A0A7S3LUI8_9EUKA|mmetsp:Transcript_47865/g.124232  ORF Transcript_47865/g.124232 Transcript_47865/m.124232 type:complete len:216 (+) Transcript_47865:1949-2596(+)